MLRSRTCGHLSVLVAVVGLWLVLSPSALAAPAFVAPPGWDQGGAASERARDRADAWAKAWSAELRQVMSPRSADHFAETLAILDVAVPIPADALTKPDAARSWLEPRVSAALGTSAILDPEGLELRPRAQPGVAVLVARVHQDDLLALIAVAPMGGRHVAVVMLIYEADEVLYARLFDDAIEGLEGLAAPVTPFRRDLVRGLALLAWLLLGSVLAFEWTRRCLPLPGPRVAGRQVAAALLASAVLVLLVVGVISGGSTVELALAGTTPWGIGLELAAGGALAAGLVLVATEVWERRLQPVASAPQAGSFAISGAVSRRHGTSESPRTTPAITGDTHVGPAPVSPTITGDTQVGRAPAVTGDTQVGRAPAISGNTKVGPPPTPIPLEELDAGPPVREVISGDIEMDTQVRRMPEPDTVRTTPPLPPSTPAEPGADEDTNPRALPGDEPPASLVDASEPILDKSLPKLEIDWS